MTFIPTGEGYDMDTTSPRVKNSDMQPYIYRFIYT